VRTIVNLDELFQLDGVTAIARLDDMGRITDWKAKGVVDPEIKKHMSKLMEEVGGLFSNFAREAPRNWSPRRALIYSGGEMTMIAAGDAGVTVENNKVNFEKLLKIFGILGFEK
jgi:roadblock/LC7 domain-containing protein